MIESVSRSVVQRFYEAYVSRDPVRIGAMVDDDVEWTVFGPVDLMQVCGCWHGKQAVVDRFTRLVPNVIAFRSLDPSSLLVDGDRSALLGRITCHNLQTGRLISHRVAHFVRYRGGKAINVDILNDSLDAAEQFVGHPILFATAAGPIPEGVVAL